MSDIDDELLALAGGDVSSADEDEEPMDMSRDESRSPSPAPAASKEGDRPARAAPVRKTPAKKSKKAGRSDESDEEGEASLSPPASPSSQMSAPMEESDSDSDSPQNRARSADDEMNQYPVEGLFKSHEEKARIMSLREIEREQILAERREENERIRQNRMLRQLKVNQEKDSKKRKASVADLQDASRKSSRARAKAAESSDRIETLGRVREERNSRREQRERENDRRRRHRSPSYRRSRSAEDRDSDLDWRGKSRQKSRTPELSEQPPADLRDVERVRVGRSRFAEACFYPGFEKAITGCFVRINIGPDPTTRQEVYRMAVIKGFVQGRPYAMPDHSGHQMVVDLYVKAAHGKAHREWPFISCSDRNFTEAEWNRYKQVCLSEGLSVPTKPELVGKIDDINRLVKRTWTEQELSEKLKRQNALHAKYSGVERNHLTRQLEMARARGDEAAVSRLQEKLDNLEVPRLAFRTSLTPAKKKAESKGPSQQEKLALLNAENRRRNAEVVRKAQLLERARAREKELRLGQRVDGDHSNSRPVHNIKSTHAVNHENLSDSGVSTTNNNNDDDAAANSGASTPAAANGTAPKFGAQKPASSSLLPHIAKLQELQRSQAKAGMPVIHKPLMDDDIIGALDLDIDVEID